jgi:hypothetical protein
LGERTPNEQWFAIDSLKVRETGSSTRKESEMGRVGEKTQRLPPPDDLATIGIQNDVVRRRMRKIEAVQAQLATNKKGRHSQYDCLSL